MKEFLYSAIILRYTVVREKGLSVAFPGLPLNFYMKFISKKKTLTFYIYQSLNL